MGLYNICVSWYIEYNVGYCGMKVLVVTNVRVDATSGKWRAG